MSLFPSTLFANLVIHVVLPYKNHQSILRLPLLSGLVPSQDRWNDNEDNIDDKDSPLEGVQGYDLTHTPLPSSFIITMH